MVGPAFSTCHGTGQADVPNVTLEMTKSIMCQFFDLGCIQVVLYLSAILKKVLVMHRLCSAYFLRSSRPLSLTLPTPCLLRTPSHLLWSFPTLALKSPRMISLSLGVVDLIT